MMDLVKALIAMLCLASATAHNCYQSEYFELLTTRNQVTDYYIGYDALPSLEAITACAWFRTTATTNTMSIISYAISDEEDNELWMGLEGSTLSWYFGKEHGTSQSVSVRDGRWHYICGTWQNRRGQWAIYADGSEVGSGTGALDYSSTIRGGGVLVIGQDQDSLGGDFDSEQSFVGGLTDVNILNRVISPYELGVLSTGCAVDQGYVFRWDDVRGGLRGNIQVLPSGQRFPRCNRPNGNPTNV